MDILLIFFIASNSYDLKYPRTMIEFRRIHRSKPTANLFLSNLAISSHEHLRALNVLHFHTFTRKPFAWTLVNCTTLLRHSTEGRRQKLYPTCEAGQVISNQTERALFSQMSKGKGKDKLQNNQTCNFDKKKIHPNIFPLLTSFKITSQSSKFPLFR